MREPSNLPPGLRESDIPGNRQADQEWEDMIDELASLGLEPKEIMRRITSTIWKDRQRNHIQ